MRRLGGLERILSLSESCAPWALQSLLREEHALMCCLARQRMIVAFNFRCVDQRVIKARARAFCHSGIVVTRYTWRTLLAQREECACD